MKVIKEQVVRTFKMTDGVAKYTKRKNTLWLLLTIVVIAVVGTFSSLGDAERKIQVRGTSMEQTLKDGDIVYYTAKDKHNLQRFDIVIIHKLGEYMVKRVVALPNENLHYENGIGYINGIQMEESYLNHLGGVTEDFTLTTNENCYILLGDNRRNSVDSREFGCVNITDIEGKVLME